MESGPGDNGSYEKIGKEHPAYSRIKALSENGVWVCDAVTHNAPEGCANPSCFNYAPSLAEAAHEGSDEIAVRLREFGFEAKQSGCHPPEHLPPPSVAAWTEVAA